MKNNMAGILLTLVFISCSGKKANDSVKAPPLPIEGTWKLITGTLIEKNDTTVTDYTGTVSFIKIINDTHFAFLQHDVHKGKGSAAVFASGGGSYSLTDSMYTEHLAYCSDRQWEGNDFNFIITLKNDTLIQRGLEKIESAGINRVNTETYVRLKK